MQYKFFEIHKSSFEKEAFLPMFKAIYNPALFKLFINALNVTAVLSTLHAKNVNEHVF